SCRLSSRGSGLRYCPALWVRARMAAAGAASHPRALKPDAGHRLTAASSAADSLSPQRASVNIQCRALYRAATYEAVGEREGSRDGVWCAMSRAQPLRLRRPLAVLFQRLRCFAM
ncbi:MAG: hypothetical protein M3R15_35655, partial [Acidobacteriota bacterium]|nr:hypothetical protein [Acidobacteriota bacterium]